MTTPTRVPKISPTRWRGEVAYEGTGFRGWQSQAGGGTVQDLLQDRLREISRDPEIRVHGSGRTDAGVHADQQVFHFDLAWPHPDESLLLALRGACPPTVVINRLRRAPQAFHARRSAVRKRYVYRIYQGYAPPREGRFCWSTEGRRLDAAAMAEAAARLRGRHDFTAFAANRADGSCESPVKNLMRLEVVERGPRIRIIAEADGFLYKMVRSLAGGLIDVGRGKLAPGQLREVLDSRRRTALIPTAQARGLTLERVFYR